MEIKFSSLVAFIFITSLVISEYHAAVVLKKFKPKRAILMESKSKENSNISSAISQHQVKEKALITEKIPIVGNSTDIKNEILSKDAMLNSTVVHQILNSSDDLSKKVEKRSCNQSNCSESFLNEQNSLTSETDKLEMKLSKESKSDTESPVFDVELANNDGSLQEKNTIHADDMLRNETQLPLKTDIQSISQESVSGNLSKLIDENFVLSNESPSIGVDTLVNKQVVTEVLSQQEGVEKVAPIVISHLDSENILTNATLLNQTEMGLESIISAGLDFLAQSEVAKNAAVAMEIFNLSDSSLTDHMVDDPDSMINLVLPPRDAEHTQDNTALNEMDAKNEQNLTIIHSNNHINNNDSTIELSTEIALESLLSDKKKCPAPGICIFWFIARNSCTNDDQCLGSKICCKVRCSKQCIDA